MNAPPVISSFTGSYRFLSNFYPVEIMFQRMLFPSVEHAYQAAKTEDVGIREKFTVDSLTAGQAKRLGRTFPLRKDWNEIKLGVMNKLIFYKFNFNEGLCDKLIQTFPAHLVEGNTWGDVFWGVYNGVGENHLGEILMKHRSFFIGLTENDVTKAIRDE